MVAALHPRERDPRQFPYGLCLMDSMPLDGVNGFHWFRSESEAAEFLRNGIWLELPTWDHYFPGTRQRFQEALRDRCDVSQEWLCRVEAEQDDLLVMWHGTFTELLDGVHPVAAGVVESYATSSESRCASTKDATPFIAFLRTNYR